LKFTIKIYALVYYILAQYFKNIQDRSVILSIVTTKNNAQVSINDVIK